MTANRNLAIAGPSKRSSDTDTTSINPLNSGNAHVGNSIVVPSTKKLVKNVERASSPAKPLIKARQVIPGMFGGPVKNLVPDDRPPPDPEYLISPVKPRQNTPIMAREVVKGTLRDFQLTRSQYFEAPIEKRADEQAASTGFIGEKDENDGMHPGTGVDHESNLDARTAVNIPHVSQQQPQAGDHPMDVVDAGTVLDGDVSQASSSRRSTRSRKSMRAHDVFGEVSTVNSSKPPRKKSSTPSGSSSLLFGTNGVALKALTNSNTARNQQYSSILEVNIVRKPGNRPESPTMKLRTISEKQKEEQSKRRAERAKRRRILDSSDGEYTGDSSMEVDELDDSIVVDNQTHRRGAGEDDDYETPDRPDAAKRVKWDRGLFTTAYLDEVEPRPERWKEADNANVLRKGCLVLKSNVSAHSLSGLAVNLISLRRERIQNP